MPRPNVFPGEIVNVCWDPTETKDVLQCVVVETAPFVLRPFTLVDTDDDDFEVEDGPGTNWYDVNDSQTPIRITHRVNNKLEVV